MADHLEEVYKKYVKPLPASERLRLLEMTVHDLALTAPQDTKKRSILELRGLGKSMLTVFEKNGIIDRDHTG